MTIDAEAAGLLHALGRQRAHVLGILEGVAEEDLRRPVLPTAWSCLGLVRHLARDVEMFWFAGVTAGDPAARGEGEPDAWETGSELPAAEVFADYRMQIERADRIITATPLSAPPAWWPDYFSHHHADLRETLLHVITETATHAGHLDAVRELIDGRTWMTLS